MAAQHAAASLPCSLSPTPTRKQPSQQHRARGEVGGGFHTTCVLLRSLSSFRSSFAALQPNKRGQIVRMLGARHALRLALVAGALAAAHAVPTATCEDDHLAAPVEQSAPPPPPHLPSPQQHHRRSSIGSCTCCTSNISISSSSSSSRRRHSSVRYSSPFCGCSRHSCRRVSQRPLDPRAPLQPPPPPRDRWWCCCWCACRRCAFCHERCGGGARCGRHGRRRLHGG